MEEKLLKIKWIDMNAILYILEHKTTSKHEGT